MDDENDEWLVTQSVDASIFSLRHRKSGYVVVLDHEDVGGIVRKDNIFLADSKTKKHLYTTNSTVRISAQNGEVESRNDPVDVEIVTSLGEKKNTFGLFSCQPTPPYRFNVKGAMSVTVKFTPEKKIKGAIVRTLQERRLGFSEITFTVTQVTIPASINKLKKEQGSRADQLWIKEEFVPPMPPMAQF